MSPLAFLLHQILAALAWGGLLFLKASWHVVQVLWEWATLTRLRKLVSASTLVVLVAISVQVLPLGWRYLELRDHTQQAALYSDGISSEQISYQLRRKAFRAGFSEALLGPDPVQVEFYSLENVAHCRVELAFTHRLDFYGLMVLKLPIRATGRAVPIPRSSIKVDPDTLERLAPLPAEGV